MIDFASPLVSAVKLFLEKLHLLKLLTARRIKNWKEIKSRYRAPVRGGRISESCLLQSFEVHQVQRWSVP